MKMTTMTEPGLLFAVDRGGTFTDVYGEDPASGQVYTEKLLSEDPANYPDAPREGIRRIMERIQGRTIPAHDFSSQGIAAIRMGTTVATNALLERKGEPTALLISRGFGDLLFIGDQTRPDLFDLQINKPELLYSQVVEVDERIRPLKAGDERSDSRVIRGRNGEDFLLLTPPDPSRLRQQLQEVYDQGLRSVAVVFAHAYAWYEHEQLAGRLAR